MFSPIVPKCPIQSNTNMPNEYQHGKASVFKKRKCIKYCHVLGCVTMDGVWIGEWIYWPLIHTTWNYKQLQRYHWSTHFTNHYTLSLLQPFIVFPSRCLVTTLNNEDSSASVLTPLPLANTTHNWTVNWNWVEFYITTDGQPANLSWNKAPIWGLRPDLIYCLTVAGLLIWGALSDERTGLSFTVAAGPCQRSLSRVRVLSYSRPYFTVSTQVWKLLSCLCGAPSLTRGRICRLSVMVGSTIIYNFTVKT
jgi:hypothetical protein